MTLVIPDYLAAKYRPLASTPTQQLINELQARQLLAEMAAQIVMPDAEKAHDTIRLEQFKLMFAQMGQAIGTSPFAFTGVVEQPDVLDPTKVQEVLIAKIMVVKHPAIPINDPAMISENDT